VIDWVFRHAGGCLIEFPPLELPAPPDRCELFAWAATVWRDVTSRTGWWTQPWAKGERGWVLPAHLAVGDVLEFGLAAVSAETGSVVAGWELRWYGWLRYCNDIAIVVDGPHPDVPAAASTASAVIAELCLSQLDGPQPDPVWVAGDAEADHT
jgi:hypothetical protein